MSRFETALEAAQGAFWEAVARSFPEITTGDLSPYAAARFDYETREALISWMESNRPLPGEWQGVPEVTWPSEDTPGNGYQWSNGGQAWHCTSSTTVGPWTATGFFWTR
jgi:hypothetical protein